MEHLTQIIVAIFASTGFWAFCQFLIQRYFDRKSAIKAKIPYITTMAAARVAAKGILYELAHVQGEVKSLQQLHSEIRDKESFD